MYNIQIHTPHVSPKTYIPYMHHIHIHAPPNTCALRNTTKILDIPIWPSLCTLWNTRSKWAICVESAVFGAFHCAFHFSGAFHENCNAFHENHCFSWKLLLFMKPMMVFIVSFWVITKYSSFIWKTKHRPYHSWQLVFHKIWWISWNPET